MMTLHTTSPIRLTVIVVAALIAWLPGGAPIAHAAAGDLDPSFGTGGKVTTDFGAINADGRSVVVQGDGKIVVAGFSGCCGSNDFALVRYATDGSLDPSFGTGGKVTTDLGAADLALSMVVQSDGKIVAAGWSSNGSDEVFALVRYATDGSLDPSFGTGGKVTTDLGAVNDDGESVVVQSDGKIVVAGYSGIGSTRDVALVRYATDGSLDPSFGTGGKVITDIGGVDAGGTEVAVQSDGKIVVAGWSYNGSNDDFALVRYMGGWSPDHYKCYQGKDLKNPKFDKAPWTAVNLVDQIVGGLGENVEVQKLKYVCTPVDKNGEGINDPNAHLICYQVKGANLAPRPKVEVSTQFQVSRFELKKPKLLCVPGTKQIIP